MSLCVLLHATSASCAEIESATRARTRARAHAGKLACRVFQKFQTNLAPLRSPPLPPTPSNHVTAFAMVLDDCEGERNDLSFSFVGELESQASTRANHFTVLGALGATLCLADLSLHRSDLSREYWRDFETSSSSMLSDPRGARLRTATRRISICLPAAAWARRSLDLELRPRH